MSPSIQSIEDGIFTIAGVFSPVECQLLIDRAETIGFEAAAVRTEQGAKMMTNLRNNDRVVTIDKDLAAQMWERVRLLLPSLDREMACGVDPQLRFYRYIPGQQFRRHKDGAVVDNCGNKSKLSYLIYLNDDFQGGTTTFREYSQVNGQKVTKELEIVPIAGMALLFRHELWHEGTSLIVGTKYVLRSDVFYRQREGVDLEDV